MTEDGDDAVHAAVARAGLTLVGPFGEAHERIIYETGWPGHPAA